MSQQSVERPPRKGLNTLRHTSVFRIINFELFARPSKFVMTFGVLCMSGVVGFLIFLNLTKEEPKPAYKKILTEDGYTTKKRTRWES